MWHNRRLAASFGREDGVAPTTPPLRRVLPRGSRWQYNHNHIPRTSTIMLQYCAALGKNSGLMYSRLYMQRRHRGPAFCTQVCGTMTDALVHCMKYCAVPPSPPPFSLFEYLFDTVLHLKGWIVVVHQRVLSAAVPFAC